MVEQVENVREWGPWSVWKTEIVLGAYAPQFLRAATGSRDRIFIDCFAGSTRNLERGTGRPIRSSPQVALQAGDRSTFTHLVLFELPEKAAALQETLCSRYPSRRIRVVPGDCNLNIAEGLAWLRRQGGPRYGPHLGAALAYLDPNALELRWSTVQALASWCMNPPEGEYRRRNRVELLILFPTGPLRRKLPQAGKDIASDEHQLEVDQLFGNCDWREIYRAQRDRWIGGEASWMHYVNLYRLGLSRLGYSYTSAIEVRNTKRVVQYHLIFATSNQAGLRIMNGVLQKAREILPRMLAAEQRRLRQGEPPLFEDLEELRLIATDPDEWASFIDQTPTPFVCESYRPAFCYEPLRFDM